jgi:hypothetical protein
MLDVEMTMMTMMTMMTIESQLLSPILHLTPNLPCFSKWSSQNRMTIDHYPMARSPLLYVPLSRFSKPGIYREDDITRTTGSRPRTR